MIFKLIGGLLDDLLSREPGEKEPAPEDVLIRGAEMAVRLFETEFDKFRPTSVGGGYQHPLGIRLWNHYGISWGLYINDSHIDLNDDQKKRLSRVVEKAVNTQKAASVQKLAEAIVARGAP